MDDNELVGGGGAWVMSEYCKTAVDGKALWKGQKLLRMLIASSLTKLPPRVHRKES